MSNPSDPLHRLLRSVLKPLTRLLLRNGVAFADFASVARQVFVEVAEQDFALPGKKQSVSRIAVLTGLNRKEVKRLMEIDATDEPENTGNNRAARVISGWLRDDAFLSPEGKPALLPVSTGDSGNSFETLVKKYSGDMPARAVLDELKRVGAVSVEDGRVQLRASGYVPASSNEELLVLSGTALQDLLDTLNFNLERDSQVPSRLQLSVAYTDLPGRVVEQFRNLSTEKGRALLLELDRFLAESEDEPIDSQSDTDQTFRAGLGIYYFEQPRNPDDSGRQAGTSDSKAPGND